MKASRSWFTWETQRRNKELAEAFNADYCHFDFSAKSSLLRYFLSAYSTVGHLVKNKPKVVFAQCPSMLLISLLALIKPLFGFIFVIDAHNSTVEPRFTQHPLWGKLLRFAAGRSDIVIVSNKGLFAKVEALGGTPMTLPDALPSLAPAKMPERFAKYQKPHVLFISTFAPDEPLDEFLQGISETQQEHTMFISGKRSKAGELLKYESDKVVFTDFLSQEDFDGLVQHSDLIVDLSTMENCLVCGSYEATEAEVPMILSDSTATRDLYPKGCIYSDNSPADNGRAFEEYFARAKELKSEIKEMKSDFSKRWSADFEEIEKVLGS